MQDNSICGRGEVKDELGVWSKRGIRNLGEYQVRLGVYEGYDQKEILLVMVMTWHS